jgi:hypothetical protein
VKRSATGRGPTPREDAGGAGKLIRSETLSGPHALSQHVAAGDPLSRLLGDYKKADLEGVRKRFRDLLGGGDA